MSTISKKLSGFIFNGTALNLASAAFKGNLNSITGFNSAGTAYTSFRPSSNFNSLTQLVQDGVYILDTSTPGFDLPGALLTAVTNSSSGRKTQFVIIGNSLSKGWYNGSDHSDSDLVTLLTAKNTDPNISFLNISHSGWSALDFLNNFSTYMAMVDFTVADDYYFYIEHGINDFYYNANVSTTFGRLQSIHQQVRAYNPKVKGTIAGTVTASTYQATDGQTHPAPADYKALIGALNTQIRTLAFDTTAAGLGAIAVCDVGAFPNFRYTSTGSVSASGTYQADNLHFTGGTGGGYDQKADIVLRSLLGVAANGYFSFPIPAAGSGLRLANVASKVTQSPAGLSAAACLTTYAVIQRAAGAENAYFLYSLPSASDASKKTSATYYGTSFGAAGAGGGIGLNTYDSGARTAGVIAAGVKKLVTLKMYASHPEKFAARISGVPAAITAAGTQQALSFGAALTVGGSPDSADAGLDWLPAGNAIYDFLPVTRETTAAEDLQAEALFSYENSL